MRIQTQCALGAFALAALSACSSSTDNGGGGGNEVQGLTTPSQLSIVTASDDENGDAGSVTAGAGATDFPATADYNTDTADTWVYDPSVEPISQVNEILCMISQTRAGNMVNQGPYIAQIDTTRCEQGSDGGDDDGQSSGTVAEFEFWTVESERNSNTSAQQVSVWVPNEESESDEELTIYVEAAITEAATAANPFGVFSMNFASAPSFAEIDTPFFLGTLSTTDTEDGVGFTFFQNFSFEGEDESIEETTAVNVTMASDQESGVARVFQEFEGDFGAGGMFSETQDYAVAFNDTHLLRAEGEEDPICLSREEFDTKVWRYNLYYADGANIGNRVELNSGFGFKTEDDDYGWIGYYGMWVPDGVELESGDTITEDVWGEENPDQYTLFQAPGRLIRYGREELDVADMEGQTFEYWEWDPETFQGANYQIQYSDGIADGQEENLADGWYKVAYMDEQSYEWVALEMPVELELDNGEWLGLWSQSLGGSVDYIHGDACECVTVYSESFVTPEDEIFTGVDEVSMFGFQQMLGTDISEEDAEMGDIFLEETFDIETPYEFTFDVETMTLLDSEGNQVGLADGAEPENGPNNWGMRSGPMLLDLTGLSNTWDVFGEDTYYVYETGHNDWNKYTAVLDSNGSPASFDPPLQFSYQHTTASDRNGDDTYDGAIYFFNYDGPGNLWGIPHEGVDLDGDEEEDRWYPLFSIEDGVMAGPTGTEYVIKATEMEQTLRLAPGECDELSLATAAALTLPTAAGFETPGIGEKPAVTDPPAVVNGEVLVTE